MYTDVHTYMHKLTYMHLQKKEKDELMRKKMKDG